MPYKLRKAPGHDLYWVISVNTGAKHSKDPLPLDRARRQMVALNIAHAREMGHVTIPKKEFVTEHHRLTRLLGAVGDELRRQLSEL